MGLWLDDGLHGCAHCRAQHLQPQRGCPEISRQHPQIYHQVGDEIYQHCLVNLVTAESLTWLQEFSFFEAGFLPEGGGLNDQWELDLNIFQLIGGEKAAIEARKRTNP